MKDRVEPDLDYSSSDPSVLTFTCIPVVTSLGPSYTQPWPVLYPALASLSPRPVLVLGQSHGPCLRASLCQDPVYYCIYGTHHGHPGYTSPGHWCSWCYMAQPAACGELAMGLEYEPFTRQCLDLHQITNVLGPIIGPVGTLYLNPTHVPYRRDSSFDSFQHYMLLTVWQV